MSAGSTSGRKETGNVTPGLSWVVDRFRRPLQTATSWIFYVLSRSFIILEVTFRSLIRFYIIFV